MSFLSIAFLVALPLAALPVLLHLFDRRRNVVIEWGAMQFLQEAQAVQTSSRRLKQWLLVALRVLALSALVFSLAQPMLPGSWFGNRARTETIVLLDNSMSMMRGTEDQTLFEEAVAEAIECVEQIPTGDSVRVLLASPYPIWATTGSVRIDSNSRSKVAAELQQLRPTSGSSDLLSALFTATQTEVEPTQSARNILLITDGQSHDWNTSDEKSWARYRGVLESASIPTQLDVVRLGDEAKSPNNIAVNGIRSNRTVVGVDQSFTLTTQVENHGQSPSGACNADWMVDQELIHNSDVPSLAAGETQSLIWKHSFSQTGVYTISCSVDGADELPADNQGTIVVQVVDEVPVVIVEDAIDQAEIQQDGYLVSAAMGWINGEPLPQRTVHVPTLVGAKRLRQLDLSEHRAVVIPNFTNLDKEIVGQLRDFVYSGGGLWIALGPRSDIEAFNELLYADGSSLAPLAVERMVEDPIDEDETDGKVQRTRINAFSDAHPATANLAGNEQLDLGDVIVSQRFEFVPPPEGEESSVLLSLSNGKPLVVEKYLGRGRVIVQAVPLRLQWTELARSQSFVVMVQNWMDYLTQPRATRHNLEPGDPISLELSDNNSRHALLTTPHGDEIDLSAETSAAGGAVFRSSRTILPGDYALDVGVAGDAIPFHVRRDIAESNLQTLSEQHREMIAEVAGLKQNADKLSAGSLNQNAPIWPLLLMCLIGLIALELLLAGLISKERFGTEAISETSDVPDMASLFSRDRQSKSHQGKESRDEAASFRSGSGNGKHDPASQSVEATSV